MFTNMLAPHHHRPPSPVTAATTLSCNTYATEQKYTPLHNAADAMRRHCMTSPVAYSGNIFAGFDDAFLRAEALVDYTGKTQFKPEPNSHSFYTPSASHYVTQQHASPAMPPPVYSSMPPPPAFHHTAALQGTLDSSDVIDQLGSSHAFPTYQHHTFNTPSVMLPTSEAVTQPHYIGHAGQAYNATTHFNPSTSVHSSAPPPPTSGTSSTQAGSTCSALTSFTPSECETDPRELEVFAERFKQRRIKLGVTQNDVGRALANLKLSGVGSLSQSTICRFESLTLSHNNMVALKPILIAWLEKAEEEHRRKLENSGMGDKKRKRTSIAAPEKRSLEAYFNLQPRPSSEKIAAIADKLDLKKNVVRVWFCNQRQKQKRMKFSAFNSDGVM